MKKFLKNIKVWSLLEALSCLVFGVLLIAFQDFTKLAIIYTFASLVMLIGLIKCFNYFCYGIEPFGFINGLVNIAISIIIFVNAQTLSDMRVFGLMFGLYFIVKGLLMTQWSADCHKFGAKYWWLNLILALVVFAMGILIVVYPQTEQVLLILIGVALIVDAIYSFVDTIVVSAKIKKARKTLKSLFEDDNKIYLDENDYDTQ